MNEQAFVASREKDWQRLQMLADRADVSPSQLTADELAEAMRLYRAAARDLATVRSESANPGLAAFLNALVGQAYGVLYRAPRKPWGEVWRAGARAAAQAVRRRWTPILASAGTLAAATLFAFAVMAARPDLRARIVDPNDPNVEAWKSGKFQARSSSEAIAMTGLYSTNNPRVTIIAASVAASTFGVGTFALLWLNGLSLGGLAWEMDSVGRLGHLVVSVAPHGASELTGIAIAGGAGYTLGGALIAPGRRRRGDALRDAGRDAFTLLLLAMAMMFAAAPVEGFFSFNPDVPAFAKLMLAGATFAAWMAFFVGYGREAPQ